MRKKKKTQKHVLGDTVSKKYIFRLMVVFLTLTVSFWKMNHLEHSATEYDVVNL